MSAKTGGRHVTIFYYFFLSPLSLSLSIIIFFFFLLRFFCPPPTPCPARRRPPLKLQRRRPPRDSIFFPFASISVSTTTYRAMSSLGMEEGDGVHCSSSGCSRSEESWGRAWHCSHWRELEDNQKKEDEGREVELCSVAGIQVGGEEEDEEEESEEGGTDAMRPWPALEELAIWVCFLAMRELEWMGRLRPLNVLPWMEQGARFS